MTAQEFLSRLRVDSAALEQQLPLALVLGGAREVPCHIDESQIVPLVQLVKQRGGGFGVGIKGDLCIGEKREHERPGLCGQWVKPLL